MEQLYLRFLCMCFILTEPKTDETNRRQLMWSTENEARQLMWHLLHPDARHFGVHVVYFWFLVCLWMRNANRQTAVDVTETNAKLQYSWCGTQNSLCCILVFAFKHGEREFTAKMSQHMFWRATSKMSEWKTSGDTAGNLSGFCAWPDSFLPLVCVWGLETVSTN